MKKIITLLTALICYVSSFAQAPAIQNIYFNNSITYSPGSGISVHFKPNGIFPRNNKFTLQLLDNSGTVVINNNIGSVNDFFIPVLNGILPAGLSAGNYTLKLVADTGGIVIATSAMTAAFTVNTPAAPAAPVIGSPSATLKVNCISAPYYYFGFVDRASTDLTQALTFQISNYSSGNSYSVKLINPVTGLTTNIPVTIAFGTAGFTLPAGLSTGYYTIEVAATNGTVSSTTSYTYLFNTGNTSLGNTSSENVCARDTVHFAADLAVILKNYPGSYYSISYGDGSGVDTFTHAEFLLNSLRHVYTTPTCLAPDTLINNGTYRVTLFLFNKGVKVGINQNCDTYSRNGNGTFKFVNTSAAPLAELTPPAFGCVNSGTTIFNTSIAGYYGTTNVCERQMNVTWYLQSPSGSSFQPVPTNWYNNGNHDLVIPPNILNETGVWRIKLITQNPEGCVTSSEDTGSICIEPLMIPDFKMNAQDSLSGCAPFGVGVTNFTNTNPCRPVLYQWRVLDSTGAAAAPLTAYSISSDTARQPVINFLIPGRYFLSLEVSNSCGIVTELKPINVLGVTNVSFPSPKRYCGPGKTIDFATDPLHRPIYDQSSQSTQSYNWSVTGGPHSFTNGTTATDRYPTILLSGIGVYFVQLIYTNSCGSKTVVQRITIDEPITADAGIAAQTICYNQDSVILAGLSGGNGSTRTWSAYAPSNPAVTGNFTAPGSLNTVYHFSNADKNRGEVWLILKVFPDSGVVCTPVSDTMRITIRPKLYADDGSKAICNGSSVSYVPTGREPAATYTWTSTIISGTVSGNTSGTGTINDILVNNSNTDAVVTYRMVPTFNGCTGDTGVLTVTIHPTPVLTVPSDLTLCQATPTGNLNFSSTVASTVYNWTNSDPTIGLPLAGSGNIGSFNAINNTTSDKVATITVTPIANGCSGTSKTFTITVKPGPPAAVAGNDQTLCAATSVTLNGNATTATGTWTQTSGPVAVITNAASANTTVTGLTPNNIYRFVWTITDGSACPANSDTVIVFNRPVVTTANAGNDTTYCAFTAPFSRALTANNPAHAWESGQWTIASNTTGITPVFSSVFDPSATLSGLALSTGINSGMIQLVWTLTNDASCAPSRDTIVISINRKPFAGNITPVNALCRNSNTTLTLNNFEGSIQKWRIKYAPFNTSTFRDTLVTASSLQLNNLQDSVMVEAIVGSTGAGCLVSDTATAMIPVNAPSEGGTTLKDSLYCLGTATGVVTLTNHIGTITWQQSTDNGLSWNFILGQTAASVAFNNLAQTTWYRAIVQNAGCSPDTSTVTKITLTNTPGASNAGADKILCSADSVLLTGNTIAGAQYSWRQIGGLPRVHSDSTQNSMWVFGLQSNQQYQFEFSLSNGVCPSSKDTISVISFAPLINKITPVADTVCSGQAVTVSTATLTGGNSAAYSFQWQTSFDGISWTNAANTQSYNFTPTASIYLRRFVSAGPCAGYSDTAFIVVEQTIGNNVISANAAICINTAAPLISGTIPAGGSGNFNFQWQQSSDGGVNWTNIPGATAKDLNPGVLMQTMHYRRNVSDTRCGSAQSNVVTILVRPDAQASFLPTTTTGCTPFVITPAIINLQPHPDRNGVYEWYANGVLIGTGQTFSGYTLLNNNDSVFIKLKTISLYGCNADSVTYKFKTFTRPDPAFDISANTGCGPLSIDIINNTVHNTSFSYLWDFGNGQVSSAQHPGAVVFSSAPTYNDTTYTIRLSVLSDCDTMTVTKTVTVKSKPKALFTPDRTVGCSPFKVSFTNNSLGTVTGYTWDFGDGTIINTTLRDTISHIYHTGVRDTFYVKLKTFNDCGADSLVYNIIVTPNTIDLDFAVNGSQQQGCAPHTVSFINNSVGATNFQWTFGDGNNLNTTRNIDTVTHTFLQPGIYQVLLRATNACSDTTGTETITVYPKPVSRFTVNSLSGCIGNTFSFSNTSDSATSYLWEFGDGNTSTLTNPSHVYTTAGVFTVKLTAFRVNAPGNSCSDTSTSVMQLVATLPGSFTASDTTSGCAPFTATFTNNTSPAISSTWNFGDGQTGSGNTVQHTYLAQGSYTVTLTTVVPGGCTYVSSKQVVISTPVGQLLYNGGYVCENRDTRFEVTTSNTDSITYVFGDGQSLTTNQLVVYHRYVNPGSYVPKVILKSNGGCQVMVAGVDTIRVDNSDAGFTASQLRTCGSTLVNFTDTSHVFFGKASVQWFFGDGGSAIGNNVSHTYTSSGSYSIRQIVTGNSGCRDTIQRQINVIVNTKPDASIVAPATGCVGQAVVFNANVQSTDPITVIKWTVSNGVTGNAANLSVNFSAPGIYTTELIAGTANGCFDTVTHNVLINPTPNVIASNDLTLCRGNSAPLNAVGASQYEWSPIQGLSCITCPNPVASPLTTTSYVVKATNSFGCSSTDTVVVTVMQPFNVNVSGSDSICIGSSSTLVASGGTTYNWSPAASLNNSTSSTVVATPSVTTTYRVIGFDGANCFTDTAFVTVAVGQYPVVNLGPDQVVASGAAVTLTPAVQNGPITKWEWSQAGGLSCTNCAQPVATILKDISYKVKATTAFGCSAEDTISFNTFCKDAQTFIPNAFTPDGDGINDVLMVRGSGIVTVKSFRIFNRWGEVVFERSNFVPNNPAFGWDGKINGIAGGPDVFVYTADVVCGNGTTFSYKGNVSLLK
jgi:gliding motility-associated-like protein